MNNSDMPARPIEYTVVDSYSGEYKDQHFGLTKREEFVKTIIGSMWANPNLEILFHGIPSMDKMAFFAIEQADALLKALEANDE